MQEENKNFIINSTTDYDKFNLLTYNRPINESHVHRLMKLMRVDNQTDIFPIVVDKDFNVVEGQHRLAAAKALKIPIYYIQSDRDFSQKTISQFNSVHRKWNRSDQAISYAKQHYDTDEQLMEVLNDPRFSGLISALCKGKFTRIQLNGVLKDNIEESTFSLLKQLTPTWEFMLDNSAKKGWVVHNAAIAFVRVAKAENFNTEHFKKKFLKHHNSFQAAINTHDLYIQFVQMYNTETEHNKRIYVG